MMAGLSEEDENTVEDNLEHHNYGNVGIASGNASSMLKESQTRSSIPPQSTEGKRMVTLVGSNTNILTNPNQMILVASSRAPENPRRRNATC